jgi:PKD repeat protein
MEKTDSIILILAFAVLLSAPVLADAQNATPTTTVPATTATTVPITTTTPTPTTATPTTTATTVPTTTVATTVTTVPTTTAAPTTAAATTPSVALPVASFSATPTSGVPPLTIQFTDTSMGSPTSWSWSFGDGGTSTSENPSYTYTSDGTYTVILTVSNSAGSDTVTEAGSITVGSAPVTSFTATPTSGTSPLTVQFIDGSTGSPTSWSWDFGDGGSSTDEDPSHTYTADGNYTVSLTASNAVGSDTATEDNYITVGSAPVASFTATPTSGMAPLTVQFTDTSSGSPTSWSWDFGDGGSSTVQNPAYTYTSPGTYSVNLTVTGPGGSNTTTEESSISVTAAPSTLALTPLPVVTPQESVPVASFIDEPIFGTAPLLVQFTDLSSGSPTSWRWDFGDGESSTEQNPQHTYTSPGTYIVSLTATNAAGSNTSAGIERINVVASSATPLSPWITIGSVGLAVGLVLLRSRSKG